MSMWKKLANPNKQIREKDDIVTDFKLRAPFWNCKPSNYDISPEYLNLIDQLDQNLEKLFKGEVDMGNAGVLDDIIYCMKAEELKKLDFQRIEHKKIILSLDTRRKSDKKDCEIELGYLRTDLQKNTQEQKVYCDLIRSQEFIKKF